MSDATKRPGLTPPATPRIGWGNPDPYSSRTKFHYFGPDGRALCGKWGVGHIRELEDGQDDHSDNCAGCKREKLRRDRSAAKSENPDE